MKKKIKETISDMFWDFTSFLIEWTDKIIYCYIRFIIS